MSRLASWWLRATRRHFCFACDKFTLREHRHSDHALADAWARVGKWQR
jgi:hypothetical protein